MKQLSMVVVFCFSLVLANPFFQNLVEAQGHGFTCGCPHCSGKGNFSGDSTGGSNQFTLNGRWASTAVSGGGLQQGDATTITWRLVDDGTTITGRGGSNMINMMDTIFNVSAVDRASTDYTQRVWFNLFDDSFNRFSELSGLSYQYEAADDGSVVTPGSNFGVQSVRADVRIGGVSQDGPGSVLAFNWFPQGGDMVFDTDDINNYGNPANNYRFLRNVIMHEHGHGVGLGHIESDSDSFLMEPFINTSFDGPQIDTIRAINHYYGDKFEKNGGNDTQALATNLGNLADDSDQILIGEDARPEADGGVRTVAATDIDFVSIDSNTDTDFYEFSIAEDAIVDILLTPGGGSYQQTVQGGGGGGTPFNSTAVSDLSLALFDDTGSLIQSIDATGAGSAELLDDIALNSGNYFIRIQGTSTNVQLYELQINGQFFSSIPEPGTAGVVALIGLGLLARRRRR